MNDVAGGLVRTRVPRLGLGQSIYIHDFLVVRERGEMIEQHHGARFV